MLATRSNYLELTSPFTKAISLQWPTRIGFPPRGVASAIKHIVSGKMHKPTVVLCSIFSQLLDEITIELVGKFN
jgi:hypothetical protein